MIRASQSRSCCCLSENFDGCLTAEKVSVGMIAFRAMGKPGIKPQFVQIGHSMK
jgi:hypothetical protein